MSKRPDAGGAAVNLQIVSPSVGVNRPLLFPDLPAATTIKQLKEKIRQALPLKPTDENQRLIHRGRALLCETDSLLDVFGADALQTPDRQTIHLVIRDDTNGRSTAPASAAIAATSPAPANHLTQPPTQRTSQLPAASQPPAAVSTATSAPPVAGLGSHAYVPSPTPPQAPGLLDFAAAHQQQQRDLSNWVHQMQRDAMARVLVNQNQRGRAQVGMRGIGDSGGDQNQPDPGADRPSPAPTHTVYRQTVGPNGHSFHVETVIRSSPPAPGQSSGLSPNDVQNILRGADATQAAIPTSTPMQRTLNPVRPTMPFLNPLPVPTAGNGHASQDLNARPANGPGQPSATTASMNVPIRPGTEVYIVASPEGPRALLFNGMTSETYYTPRFRPPTSMIHPFTMASHPGTAFAAVTQSYTPIFSQLQQHQQPQPASQPQPQPQQPQQQPQRQPQQQQLPVNNTQPVPNQPPARAAAQPAALRHGNNVAAGVPPLMWQAMPHMWLVLRLAVFVWLFTSPNSSWSRWCTVICLAIGVFLFSTGVLNGFAEQVWRPIGRHLENILPMPEGRVRRQQQRQPAGLGAPEEQRPLLQATNLDPAQMAARLVADRERQSWLGVQFRRLERAGLLFLASIAPGVAERHIANLAAEMEAEERRAREAAEAATAAAAAASAEANQSTQATEEARATETATSSDRHDGQENLPRNTSQVLPDSQRSEEGSDQMQNHRAREHGVADEGIGARS